MKRHDWYLIFGLFLLSTCLSLFFLPKGKGTTAQIYVSGILLKTVPLTEDKTFEVQGTNGPVTLEVKQGKIQVIQENSPKHLCSKQGFINNPTETIVCLPNELVITITGDTSYDTIAR